MVEKASVRSLGLRGRTRYARVPRPHTEDEYHPQVWQGSRHLEFFVRAAAVFGVEIT